HIAALTEGISRRAAIQRQLLPVMLGWFGDGPDPDAGLLAFRKLSEAMGTTHWYLKLLRDSGAAARRLARLLSGSSYVAQALPQLPEAVAWLDDDADLEPRGREALQAEMDAMLRRREEPGEAARAARYLRRRELTRAAVGDVLDQVRGDRGTTMLTPAADVALRAALRIAVQTQTEAAGLAEPPSDFLVVAMGRLGGAEMSYGSDADVLFVHEPRPGAEPEVADRVATAVATQVRSLLGDTGPEPPLPVDAALRPEGRNGPIMRTLGSYAEYYSRWAEPWERQALLRARPVAGDEGLAARFGDLVDPVRYPADGLDPGAVRELRRIKARMESERMPRGVEPTRHLKLGRGGLSDVEWTVQLLQLQHAGRVPGLRTTSTLGALHAAEDAGLLGAQEVTCLSTAWELAARIRNAIALGSGRTSGAKIDVLPSEPRTLAVVARMLGYDPERTQDVEEDYLRAARRARAVVDRVFFG
ncbi:bifunctional [glutamine synthetase] adenylyltransferase/[glutamine synthetase]-adenylyl-L-tyrosine phosphorylase, partial [Georgenia sp. 10Sc9-8]|nr:bifunctional [glutamine synthetase] adenylyltransferase/[glutamine synthetase]-adenylyl-L-tyrosine phosphorylase [Georgenia halotolerans]